MNGDAGRHVTILDGGLSTALEEQGCVVDGDLWTAQLLARAPERILAAHQAFFEAGAQVAITATYQASVPGFVAAGMSEARARELIVAGVKIARQAACEFEASGKGAAADVRVAASVGPYGAYLADGSEYRGNYGVSAAASRDFHAPRLELLASAGPDLFAVETIPDVNEAIVLRELLEELGVPAWLSYSLRAGRTCAGQSLTDAYDALAGSSSLIAGGVNCSDPSEVTGALKAVSARTGLPGVAYPNRGGTWDSGTQTWSQQQAWNPALVDEWVAAGAAYVGGCCGWAPADIAALAGHRGSR